MNILTRDYNTKVWIDNRGSKEIMGKRSLWEINYIDNGERFAEICGTNNLVIGGSIFPHKRVHKATRASPDQSTENHRDHICIYKKFCRSLIDCRVKRGAYAASYYPLLKAKIKLT